jgi:pimeloyl-ACP methyl ester carboxylesterase
MAMTRTPSSGLARMAMEQRVFYELGAFAAASPLLRAMGRGDRHPVLVLPGFTAGDASTTALRRTLRSQGYWVHGWRLGRNIGPTQTIVDGLVARLELLHERHEAPVSLVGWSLGGIFARGMAREHPDLVRQVITLGSPYRMRDSFGSPVARLYRRFEGVHVPGSDPAALLAEEDLPALTMPSTSIYTRTDGVVHWSLCIEAEGEHRENIEVQGTHVGLGVNPAVIYAISDRLAQPAGEWRPFRRNALIRRLYPEPVWWTPDAPGRRRRRSAAV